VNSRSHLRFGSWIVVGIGALLMCLQACGGEEKKEQKAAAPAAGQGAISGTITLDPSLKGKMGKGPLLLIMGSKSPEPNKPAIVVKRVAGVTFPYQYKLTAEDITLVGSTFDGKMYVTARIDPAGTVGAARPGNLEGTYPGNPVVVGSTNVDIVINKAY